MKRRFVGPIKKRNQVQRRLVSKSVKNPVFGIMDQKKKKLSPKMVCPKHLEKKSPNESDCYGPKSEGAKTKEGIAQ